MTNLRRVAMALLVFGLMACASWAAESVRVTVRRANLRSAPTTRSSIVAKVVRGTTLEVLGREGDWLRVAAPGGGGPAYIAARLCEEAPAPAPSASVQPAAEEPPIAPSRVTDFSSSGEDGGTFGAHLSLASRGVGFGLGARASTGIPVISHLGALVTLDVFFGSRTRTDAAGVELDEGGHSLQLGLFPTYSLEGRHVRAYAGIGLTYFRSSYSAPSVEPAETPAETPAVEPVETLPGSASSTAFVLLAGATFRKHFLAELRYQFGGASHLTFSAGIVFDAPW